MNILGPLALNAMLATGDEWSTQRALARPGTYEMGHAGVGAKAFQAACFTGADLLIQHKKPKLRWYYRGLVVVGHVLVIRHNLRKLQCR